MKWSFQTFDARFSSARNFIFAGIMTTPFHFTAVLVFMFFILTGCGSQHSFSEEAPMSHEQRELKDILSLSHEQVLPYEDTTNFDNYEIKKPLSKAQEKLLQLGHVTGQYVQGVEVRHYIRLSPAFTTLVVSFHKGEHELFTSLVNYDSDGHMTDWLEVAYDEIAESLSRKESTISTKEIVVRDISYFTDPPETEVVTYGITDKGKFVKR